MSRWTASRACLKHSVPPNDRLASEGAFLMVAVLLLLCLAVSALLARFWLQKRYRTRLASLMNFESVRERPKAWWDRSPFVLTDAPGSDSGIPQAEAVSGSPDSAALRRAQLRITLATLAAWLSFGLGAWLSARLSMGQPSVPLQMSVFAGTLLATLGLVLANLPPTAARWKTACVALGAAIGLVIAMCQPTWEEFASALLFLGAWMALHLLGSRSLLRALWLLLSLGLLGAVVPALLLEPLGGDCLQQAAAKGEASVAGAMATGLVMSLVVLGLCLAFRCISGLANALARGWLGEVSATVLLDLILVAGVLVAILRSSIEESSAGKLLSAGEILADLSTGLGLTLLCLGLAVAAYALVLRMVPALPYAGRHLLVLRVFSKDEKQHRFLDLLQAHWRYLGPVSQIGGPDLAPRNIGMFVSLMFLSGRLYELFLPQAAEAQRLRKRLQLSPDAEGRFRVNEVFCFNTAWQGTVEQLMQLADVIVLDLRGFCAQRKGTGFEIEALLRAGLLPRVWVLQDRHTCWADVQTLLDEASKRAGADSPLRFSEQQCWDCDARARPYQHKAVQDLVSRLLRTQA
ncbi:hypothetical protein [Paucibacter sp. Y2R2-4]|uniref:hypothetical protein n=1 Tax=Paucibacter sp. Y2R2-4 TaxID=2893553 RepID=UPI0021E37B81|nr:hypothetical protein [Paucibacter sp. Y2R2-4]MCV2349608.1 hypothetical protein [Paucibacter sp. Y2R2-4]